MIDAIEATGDCAIVTADHGNADEMLEPDGSPDTAHSLNPVPLIVTRERHRACATAACWPTSCRPRSTCWASRSRQAMTGRSLIR